jgi:hypothetical protein
MLVVVDGGIRPREKQGLVPTVFPPDDVRGRATRAPDFDHLTVPIRLADPMSLDNDAVTGLRFHDTSLIITRLPA